MSRPRFKTKKVSHLISKDSFSPESNWRMEELSLTTTSKRSPHSILSLDLEVVVTVRLRENQHLLNLPESTSATNQTAERESAVTTVISDQRKSSNADFIYWVSWTHQ